MKKSILFTIILLFPILVNSQKLTEKSLFRFDNIPGSINISLVNFDEKTGTYLYQYYDTITKKCTIYSNKGNSDTYDNIEYYNAIFDNEGNYYVISYNSLTDTTFIYFILKNGKEAATYENITDTWSEKNGTIYFACKDKGKSFLAAYDMASGKVSKGKEYDEVQLCHITDKIYDEEPPAYIGFTSDGKPYYIAKSNDEAFLVIGEEEQRHYSDIDAYSVKVDAADNFVFPAKSSGKFYDAGNTFLVQGVKEYKKFDYIYTPIYFGKTGDAIYTGVDSGMTNTVRLMEGNNEISKTYSDIYNLNVTPAGKLYFTAGETDSKDVYSSFIVFDGKEGKHYQSVGTLKILPGDKLLYTASIAENKPLIVYDNKETKPDDNLTLLDAAVMGNGTLVYVNVKYGNYDKKIKDKYYVHIGDDEFGPYDGVLPTYYSGSTDEYVLCKGNDFAYLTNSIVNYKDYIYKQTLYWNDDNSEEFDNIENIALVNGKPVYTAPNTLGDNKSYKYRVFYNNKPISPEYESLTDYNFNEATKHITFTGLKGKEFYKVEIQF